MCEFIDGRARFSSCPYRSRYFGIVVSSRTAGARIEAFVRLSEQVVLFKRIVSLRY